MKTARGRKIRGAVLALKMRKKMKKSKRKRRKKEWRGMRRKRKNKLFKNTYFLKKMMSGRKKVRRSKN